VPVVAVPHPLQYTSEMQAVADNGLMLALFSLGGGEIILILARSPHSVWCEKAARIGPGTRPRTKIRRSPRGSICLNTCRCCLGASERGRCCRHRSIAKAKIREFRTHRSGKPPISAEGDGSHSLCAGDCYRGSGSVLVALAAAGPTSIVPRHPNSAG
jgi:hypothetical protein